MGEEEEEGDLERVTISQKKQWKHHDKKFSRMEWV
ncbi:unnamed protein product, partial [Onchocerca ochengi]|uniref:DDX50 n=1 Tax=Onchocerca ochengi TaxID=42157 RepID=A0A182EA86_ONCOC